MSDAGDVRIRAARRTDLARVAEIYGHYVLSTGATFDVEPPSVDDWHGRFTRIAEQEQLPFLVAESAPEPASDGPVLGYAYLAPFRPKAAYFHTVEDSVYLAPEAKGRGVGRRLIEALIPAAAATGRREIIAVIADTGDPSSMILHERCGFTHAGRLARVGFKHGRWLDTVQMQYTLSGSANPPADAAS
jgi:phosphinothricin acetyltransferase